MYLKAYVLEHPEFKAKYENPNKNIDDCLLYIQAKILEKVTEEQKKDGAAVVIPSDDELFDLAVSYYSNDDLKIEGDKFDDVKVLSVSATTFTDEEKQKMRQEAIKKYQDDVIAEQKKKDQERKEKAKKKNDKKPSNPILVPDTKEEEDNESKKAGEKTAKVVQMSLF